MNEENQNQAEVSIGVVGAGGNVISVEFADGVHLIPERVVAELGAEALQQIAPALKQKTYGELISGFNLLQQKRAVNNFGRNFVDGHFGRKF